MKNFTLRLYLHLSKSFLDHGDDEMTKNCLSIFSHSQRNPNQTDTLKNRKRKKKVPRLMLVNINHPNCIEAYRFTQNLSLQLIVHEFLTSRMKSKRMSKRRHRHSSCWCSRRRRQGLNSRKILQPIKAKTVLVSRVSLFSKLQ